MKDSRTSDHIFLLQTLIEKVVRKNKRKLFTAYIDFKKAYDTVDRELLFERLKQIGMNGLFLQNIKAMYENTKYSIKLKDGYLDPIASNLGLRQGCPLSPMLFNLYIEDIKEVFDNTCEPITLQDIKINHFLYADDLVLVSHSANGLQNSLDKLASFAESRHLTINIKKSKTMIFNAAGRLIKKEFRVNNESLEAVNSFCYLGFEIKPSGTVKHAMNTLYYKAKRAMRPLLCTMARFNIPVKTSIKLFHTYISPILLYNVENWAIMTDSELNKFTETSLFDKTINSSTDIIHRQILKYTLGLSKSCPNMPVYGDTGEIPLSIKGYRLMLNYWNRLKTLPETNLAKKALIANAQIRTNWISTIEKLLKTFNLLEATDKTINFKRTLRTNAFEYYKALWENTIKNQEVNRLAFYQKLKKEFTPSKYIDLLNFKMRKTIAKIRCSNHCLAIEKGRHHNTPRELRICTMCTDKVVEDEEHFLTKCKSYEHLRVKHKISGKKTTDLMNCDNQSTLANYIIDILDFRKNTLDLNQET